MQAALAHPKMQLAGAIVHEPELLGKDVGELLQTQPVGVAATHLSGTDFAVADAVIDFTLPQALPALLEKVTAAGTPLVTGTTGLGAGLQQQVAQAAKKIPIVQSFNMSLGVNLLAALVEQAAQALGDDFDIEINELHHKHKKDAPSGTAKLLAQAAAKARGVKLEEVAAIDRNGERKTGDIGFSVLRGGGVIGDHTVMFLGDNERLELTHRGHNRRIYADGALKAAAWLQGKPAGLYSMRDVLGI